VAGIFILSLDTEIGWGLETLEQIALYEERLNRYREFFPKLVLLLDKYQIPATWALVGHLFLEKDEEPLESLEPYYAHFPVANSPYTPLSNPRYYRWFHAPDIVNLIRNATVEHEIGTHTFTHVCIEDIPITTEIWHSQMTKSIEIHGKRGLNIRSIVFPKNQINFLDTLSEYGIIAYRGLEESWYQNFPAPLRRFLHLLDRTMAFPPPTYDPSQLQVGSHLVNLPASQFLMHYDGIRRWIPLSSRVQQAVQGLERAAKQNHLYHLWFHPHNLGSSNKMFDALEEILQEVTRRRDDGRIKVMTMEQAARWILQGMPKHGL
jgi:peptidoglycan/xylan/chitin deacetylase (PgdA/CDA1 family)